MARFGRYIEKAISAAEKTKKVAYKPLDKVIDKSIDGVVHTAKNASNWKGGKLLKKTDPSFSNAYTGYREGAGLIIGASVVGGAYGMTDYKMKTEFVPKTGEIAYNGAPPIMDAEGVGTTPNSQAPTLGASGSMVFGMHNARKG